MNDELYAFLRSSRSIRRFKPDSEPAAFIQRILETATYAPSAPITPSPGGLPY